MCRRVCAILILRFYYLMPSSKRHKASRHVPSVNSDTARYIQFLRIAPNSQVVKSTIAAAPPSVIKVLSNAALNAQRGRVSLGPKEIHEFSRHRPLFKILSSRSTSVNRKRRAILSQKGGAFPLIPLLLGGLAVSFGKDLIQGGRINELFGK